MSVSLPLVFLVGRVMFCCVSEAATCSNLRNDKVVPLVDGPLRHRGLSLLVQVVIVCLEVVELGGIFVKHVVDDLDGLSALIQYLKVDVLLDSPLSRL